MDDKSFEDLLECKHVAHSALQQRLADALDDLAVDYVRVHGRKDGMEQMCDDFFRHAASKHYPNDGWPGLLSYAVKQAG